MVTLSPATLNLLRDCPRCFWLHQVQGIKRPQGPMASIAVGLDATIKAYCNTYRATGALHDGFPFAVDVKPLETDRDRAYECFRQAVGILRQPEPPPSSDACEYCAWLHAVAGEPRPPHNEAGLPRAVADAANREP